ncbi:MAG TPA: Na-translocating system protein MpsC family protein [Solirubrobacteraceae bacterium]|jgi:uncharacterized protein YbcI|nr:Na-translocating system protein MpsC family protein [Solirubrobacteraceae bacterium]
MEAARPAAAIDSGPQTQSALSAISNEMVAIYKDQFGRGPTKTRTHWAGPDVLVVTLENTFTSAERTLLALGEHERLRDLRLLFQYAEVARFCAPVERLTGRKVRAFISGIDTAADLATEMFVLHPEGYDGPSRSAAAER